MVELGSYKGGASLHFLNGGGHNVVAFDLNPRHDPELFDARYFASFKTDSLSDEAAKLRGVIEPVDVLFIDTDHTYERTAKEFEGWRCMVKPGGLILFDDICAPEFGCTKFWNELEGEKLTLPELHPEGWGFGVYFA